MVGSARRIFRPFSRLGPHLTTIALALAFAALPFVTFAASPLLASAAIQPPQGTWTTYGILSNTGVTNTGPSVIQGDLGSSGNSSANAVTGFQPSGPGTVTGNIVLGGAAITAQTDATDAVNALESQASTCTTLNGDLGGQTVAPGVYCFSAGLTGTLILNAGADPNAIFIFLTSNNLVVNPNATVALVGSSSCNVYWRTKGLASLDTNVTFIGTIFASSQVTMNDGARLSGRAIAQTANVTLIDNAIESTCAAGAAAATPTAAVTQTPSTTKTATPAPTLTRTSTSTSTSVATSTSSPAATSPSPPSPSATPVVASATPVVASATPVVASATTVSTVAATRTAIATTIPTISSTPSVFVPPSLPHTGSSNVWNGVAALIVGGILVVVGLVTLKLRR